jgi:hypothetical protein
MLRYLSDPPGDVNEGNFPLEKTIENDKEACDPIVLEDDREDSCMINYSAGNHE